MTDHISTLIPEKGERVITLGGTRSGKSTLQDMGMREVQRVRPTAMQLLFDTKPRYRAQTERGRFRRGRKDASYRYESWSAGPLIPNSVVVDIWDDHPFKGLWEQPGEIAIMQGAELDDWKRMLALARGFVNVNIKGRERRLIVDECLDFTRETRLVLILKTTCSTVPLAQVENGELVLIWAPTAPMECRPLFCTWRADSIFSICGMTKTCAICKIVVSEMPNLLREIISSANTESNLAELSQTRIPVGFDFRIRICDNFRNREVKG
jgi:hypothetical protein